MGVLREGLDDHEGYAARKLEDGTLTGTWTQATAAFTAYTARCACGWTATAEHPPTEAGEDAALGDWAGHADQQHPTTTGSRNLLACQCLCGRKLRVAKATLEQAPIVCGACEEPFEPTLTA